MKDIAGLLLVSILYASFVGCGPPTAAISTHTDSISFGTIDTAEPVRKSARITVTNNSDESEVVYMKPNCGCIVLEDLLELPAHSSKDIQVEIEIAPTPGPFRKELALTSRDGELITIVGLTGTVRPNAYLLSVPASLNYGELESGKVRSFKLFRFDSSPVKIESITCPPGFEVITTNNSPKREVHIEVKCTDDSVPIEPSLSIRVLTLHKVFDKVIVPIKFTKSR